LAANLAVKLPDGPSEPLRLGFVKGSRFRPLDGSKRTYADQGKAKRVAKIEVVEETTPIALKSLGFANSPDSVWRICGSGHAL